MNSIHFLSGKVELRPGDCLEALKSIAPNSIDSCVTDPPYHLTSIVKRFGSENAAPCKEGKTGAYKRASTGFMGKQWDGGDIAFRRELWAEVFSVMKPGAHLVAFSATRTYHRMVCAIEDAGFEVRDQIGWAFGSGFPKSHNIGDGWGTALKPAWEPIVLSRKPLSEKTVAANVLEHGTGAINIDGCRVGMSDADFSSLSACVEAIRGRGGKMENSWANSSDLSGVNPANPLSRWPANLIHDASDEVVRAFPDAGGGSGSAARFFYAAKADADDRLGSKHPTVKPVDLMRYLVRLVTPKGGLVLDPFAGTGTTGEAAFREGMRAILIEREEEYQADIRRRMELVLAGPDERQHKSIKARGLTAGAGPLFEGAV